MKIEEIYEYLYDSNSYKNIDNMLQMIDMNKIQIFFYTNNEPDYKKLINYKIDNI